MDWPAIQQRLAADVDNWGAIAKAVGLPRMTVARIGSGETPAPRVDTAQKIAAYYALIDAQQLIVDQAQAVAHSPRRPAG